jgi:hypothetical protein
MSETPLDADIAVMERHGHHTLRIDIAAWQDGVADDAAMARLHAAKADIDRLGLMLLALRGVLGAL